MNETKFCKFCGETIDYDCVVCTKCGKQVEALDRGNTNNPIIINNSSSSSSSAASVYVAGDGKTLPWYFRAFWIFILGMFTGGIYWVVGIVLRIQWSSKH